MPLPDFADLGAMFRDQPPALDFVLPGMISGTVGLLVGMGSAGKSMLAIQIAISVAAGKDVFGVLGYDPKPGPVVYLSGEDQLPVLHHRLHAMGKHIPPEIVDNVVDYFRILPVYGLGMSIGQTTEILPDDTVVPGLWSQAVNACQGARLVLVDTLIRFAGGRSENDNVEMSEMMSHVEIATRVTGAAFLMIHHVGKSVGRDGTSGSDQTATRGASALTDNARWQANLAVMSKEEGASRGYDGDERKRFVHFEITKQNYGAATPAAWLERGEGGILKRGEPNEKGRRNGQGRI